MLSKAKEALISWSKKHPLEAAFAAVALVVSVFEFLKKVVSALAVIDSIVGAGTIYNGKEVVAKPWFDWTLSTIVVCVIVFVALYARAQVQLTWTVNENVKRSEVAIKTLTEMMTAAFRIRQQLIPASQMPLRKYDLISSEYLIHNDFTVEVSRSFDIRATGERIHFLKCRRESKRRRTQWSTWTISILKFVMRAVMRSCTYRL